jgi:hypothetical protein
MFVYIIFSLIGKDNRKMMKEMIFPIHSENADWESSNLLLYKMTDVSNK